MGASCPYLRSHELYLRISITYSQLGSSTHSGCPLSLAFLKPSPGFLPHRKTLLEHALHLARTPRPYQTFHLAGLLSISIRYPIGGIRTSICHPPPGLCYVFTFSVQLGFPKCRCPPTPCLGSYQACFLTLMRSKAFPVLTQTSSAPLMTLDLCSGRS